MRIRAIAAIGLGLLTLAACESDKPATRAGMALDQAGTATGTAVDKAATTTGNAVGGAANRTGNYLDRQVNGPTPSNTPAARY